MPTVASKQQQSITLQGSTTLLGEYFMYSIYSILYQRGLYPEDSFVQRSRHGMTVLMSTDEQLIEYMDIILKQIKCFLNSMVLRKLVLVVTSEASGDVLERWQFDVKLDRDAVGPDGESEVKTDKSEADIRKEIAAILKQIVASVSLLPLLEEPCTYDLLLYTDKGSDIPQGWDETGPKIINNAAHVKMRSFSTRVHQVDTCVTYKKS